MASGFTFRDNSQIILSQMAANIRSAMKIAGETAVDGVREKMLYGYHDVHGPIPHTEIVDTGALFDSIDSEVTKDSQNLVEVTVGAGTKYAKHVHEGTYKLRGRPFIKDGIEAKQSEIKDILSSGLKKGF